MIDPLLPIAIPVVFLTGVGMMFHKRTRLHARLFLMLAFFMMVTSIRHRRAEEIELNPRLGPNEMVGVWTGVDSSLRLNGDHTYEFSKGSAHYDGTWDSNDWNLSLTPDRHDLGFYPRVIRLKDELRIVEDARDIDGVATAPYLYRSQALPAPEFTATVKRPSSKEQSSSQHRARANETSARR